MCLSWTQQHPLKRWPWQRGGSCCLSSRHVSERCANGSHFMVTFPACNTASPSWLSTFWGIRQLLYYTIKLINRALLYFWDCKAPIAYYQVTAKLYLKLFLNWWLWWKGQVWLKMKFDHSDHVFHFHSSNTSPLPPRLKHVLISIWVL